jgi:hypothetical protein
MSQVEATPVVNVPGGEDASLVKKDSTPSTFDLHSGLKAYVLHVSKVFLHLLYLETYSCVFIACILGGCNPVCPCTCGRILVLHYHTYL